MPLKFVKSIRNRDMLLLKGYLYYKISEYKSRVSWRCVHYKKLKCRCTCVTYTKHATGHVLKESRHNHPANGEEVKAKRALHKAIEYRRRLADTNPKPAIEPAVITIPDACKVTNKNESFLLYGGDGRSDTAVLLFSTRFNLDVLNESSTWICTRVDQFSVPVDFSQLLTIHCRVRDNAYPLVHALMTDQRKCTYEQTFKRLAALRPALRPKSVHTHFHRPFVSEFERAFPDVHVKGCFGDFCACVWQKLQSFGLKTKYAGDPTFAEQVKCLCALSFVPVRDVATAYRKLVASKYYADNSEWFRRILSYFENTWVGRLAYGRTKRPVFPVEMWNSYEMVVNEEPDAATPIDGWNRKLKSTLGDSYSDIADFVGFMKTEQDRVEADCLERPTPEDATAGPGTGSDDYYNAYLDRDVCLKAIVDNYDFGDTLLYLKYVSQTFEF